MNSKQQTRSILVLLFCFQFCLNSGELRSDVILDQSYDAIVDRISFNNGFALTARQSLSQTFTVGVSGQLAQIDVQAATTSPSPTTGLVLDILSVVNGEPTINSLGSVEIPLGDIPPRFPQVPGNFVNVDVSSLGIMVEQGDVLAFELTHPTDTGSFTWFFGGVTGYAGGGAFFRNPPSTSYGVITDRDLGFQTYVDAIPEPAASGLLWSLLLGASATTRRRRVGRIQ